MTERDEKYSAWYLSATIDWCLYFRLREEEDEETWEEIFVIEGGTGNGLLTIRKFDPAYLARARLDFSLLKEPFAFSLRAVVARGDIGKACLDSIVMCSSE